jgi:bifunctional DNA-binding transcriptional regulator/antitoxin component of YhaV-PrlF toxin-antitoxin module
MKITRTGRVAIPRGMRRKHGLLGQAEVKLVDQPDGVLVVKATPSRGKHVWQPCCAAAELRVKPKIG